MTSRSRSLRPSVCHREGDGRGRSANLSAVGFHFRLAEGSAYSKDVYQNDEEHFEDLAKAYQVELDMLYQAGLRNVQIDDPTLACEFQPGRRSNRTNPAGVKAKKSGTTPRDVSADSGSRLLLHPLPRRLEKRHEQHKDHGADARRLHRPAQCRLLEAAGGHAPRHPPVPR